MYGIGPINMSETVVKKKLYEHNFLGFTQYTSQRYATHKQSDRYFNDDIEDDYGSKVQDRKALVFHNVRAS